MSNILVAMLLDSASTPEPGQVGDVGDRFVTRIRWCRDVLGVLR
jgi:hypothetical protein